MDEIREILVAIQNGKNKFAPETSASESVRAFQPTAVAIKHAEKLQYFSAIFRQSKMIDTYGCTLEAIVTSPLSYEALQLLKGPAAGLALSVTTGWQRVDRVTNQLPALLAAANNEEDYQAIGVMARECFISLAQAVYARERHPPLDGTEPSETDAKRMLEAYIAVELAGNTNEAARKHARAAIDFANSLQHQRTASRRDATLCVEALGGVVKLIDTVAGDRNRKCS